MYRLKEMFSFFILFLAVQKQITDNIVNAEEHSSISEFENLINELDEPVLCDQCLPVIVACLKGHSACERIICSNNACKSCFEVQCPESQNIVDDQNQNTEIPSDKSFESDDPSFFIRSMFGDDVLNGSILSAAEAHQSAEKAQNSHDESELYVVIMIQTQESVKSMDNSSEHLDLAILSEESERIPLADHSKNTQKCSLDDHPALKFTLIVFVICVCLLLLKGIQIMRSTSAEIMRVRKSTLVMTKNPYVSYSKNGTPINLLRRDLAKNIPPPSYEQSATECTRVPMEEDASQPRAESA